MISEDEQYKSSIQPCYTLQHSADEQYVYIELFKFYTAVYITVHSAERTNNIHTLHKHR